MAPINYRLTYYKQTTPVNCSQAALAMLLSYYGRKMTVDEVMRAVPRMKNEAGETLGSNLIQELGTWCRSVGFKAEIYTFDCRIIDLDWANLPKKELRVAMKKASGRRINEVLGKHSSKSYLQTYVDFVNVDGKLHILPAPSVKLLHKLLQRGPFLAAAMFNTLYGKGGSTTTHSIVVYGVNKRGEFLIADPFAGRTKVSPERLIAAIMAAQLECDNLLLQIKKR